jgi:hypothetical protein
LIEVRNSVAKYDGASTHVSHTLSVCLSPSMTEFRHAIVCTPLALRIRVSPSYCAHTDAESYLATNEMISKDFTDYVIRGQV